MSSSIAVTPDQVDEPHPYYRHKVDFFARWAERGRALDYGCGQGHYSRSLAARGWSVTGVDVDAGRLAEARDRATEIGLGDRCEFVEVGLTDRELPFEKGHFDAIFASEVIEHVPDPLAWITELKRILRRDGTLYLTTPNAVSYRHVGKNLLWNLRGGHTGRAKVIESWPRFTPGKEGHIVAYEFETLYRWANLNGFELVAMDFAEIHDGWRKVTNVVTPLRPLRTGLVVMLRHTDPDLLYS